MNFRWPKKSQTFTLAAVVIGSFLLFYGITLMHDLFMPAFNIRPNCDPFEGLEKVTSTLGPIVAAIIGYYFGQRPVVEVAGQRDLYKRQFTDLYNEMGQIRMEYEELLRSLQNIKRDEGVG